MSPRRGFCTVGFNLGPEHSNLMPEATESAFYMIQFAYDLTRYVVYTFAQLKDPQYMCVINHFPSSLF